MIEDNEAFFSKHGDPETRKRGLYLVACIAAFRSEILRSPIAAEAPPIIDFKALPIIDSRVLPANDFCEPIPATSLDVALYEANVRAILFTRGNLAKAQRELGCGRQTLYNFIFKYKLLEWVNHVRQGGITPAPAYLKIICEPQSISSQLPSSSSDAPVP